MANDGMKRLAKTLHNLGWVVVDGELEVISVAGKQVDSGVVDGLKLNQYVKQHYNYRNKRDKMKRVLQ